MGHRLPRSSETDANGFDEMRKTSIRDEEGTGMVY